jgi:hypothetical protein
MAETATPTEKAALSLAAKRLSPTIAWSGREPAVYVTFNAGAGGGWLLPLMLAVEKPSTKPSTISSITE